MDSHTETPTFDPYTGPVFPVEEVKTAADMQSSTPVSSSSVGPFPEIEPAHWNLDPIYDAEQFIFTADDFIAEAHPKIDGPVDADFKQFNYTADGVLAKIDTAIGIDHQANEDEAVEMALSPQLMPVSDEQLMDFETQDGTPELALTPSTMLLLEELEEMKRTSDEEPVELALDDDDSMDLTQVSPNLYYSPEQGFQLDGAANDNQQQNTVGALNVPFSEMHLNNGSFSRPAMYQGNITPFQHPQNMGIHPRVEELFSPISGQGDVTPFFQNIIHPRIQELHSPIPGPYSPITGQVHAVQRQHNLPVSQPLTSFSADGAFMGQQQQCQAQFPLPNRQSDSSAAGKDHIMTVRVFRDKSFHVSFNESNQGR